MTAEEVGTLARQADEIGSIVQLIDDIAEQTSLLALNVAIEAARAGDMPRMLSHIERMERASQSVINCLDKMAKAATSRQVGLNCSLSLPLASA